MSELRDASEVFGFDDLELDEPRPIPKPPPGPCDRCPHEEHLGPCGMEKVVQGVTTDCGCFTVQGMTTDVRTLRQADARQQRDVEALKRAHGYRR